MKRIGFILLAIAAVLIGLLVGTLNSDPVQLDLLWIQFELPLGLAILLGFSLGVVIGLAIIYFTRVLPLRLQLRKARAKLIKQDAADLNLPDD
jgi:putative membrane protein